MTILFSLAVGRATETGAKRCINAIRYNPGSTIIVNCDKSIDKELFKSIVGEYMDKSVFINPIPRSPHKDCNLLDAHLRNYQYARDSGISFTYVYMLSDTDMFFRKGLFEFISNYHAGFFMTNCFLNHEFKRTDAAGPEVKDSYTPDSRIQYILDQSATEGEYTNQKTEPFWKDGFLKDKRIERIMSEQIEGSFYERSLFEKINEYLEQLPVHYSKIERVHYEELTFANVYMNIFKEEYPIHLPVGTIYRSDDISFRTQHLINIMVGEKHRESMPVMNAWEFYHPYVFGIKRVKYNENWDQNVNQVIKLAKSYLESQGLPNEYLGEYPL